MERKYAARTSNATLIQVQCKKIDNLQVNKSVQGTIKVLYRQITGKKTKNLSGFAADKSTANAYITQTEK